MIGTRRIKCWQHTSENRTRYTNELICEKTYLTLTHARRSILDTKRNEEH